jgi:hypothetical protein
VVVAEVAAIPHLGVSGQQLATAVKSGDVQNVINPDSLAAPHIYAITRAAFTAGLNRVFLIGAIIAFTAGVLALVLIRSKDFVRSEPDAPAA